MTKIWTQEEEASRLHARFDAAKREGLGQAEFARKFGVKGGASMISQHIKNRRPISLEAAKSYARGFQCSIEEISPRLAEQVASVTQLTSLEDRSVVQASDVSADAMAAPQGYVRLEHLSPSPSMGSGAHLSEPVQIVQYIDVLEQWVRQEVGTANPARIKILTGNGNSMAPTIKDKDLVFVDVECRSIETAGIYVLDVAGRLILKKAMILASGTLVIRSDNVGEYPDEERYDLRYVADSITVCGKVLAWWTLGKA